MEQPRSGRHDTVVAVRIVGVRGRSFSLAFDRGDLVGRGPFDPDADVTLTVSAATVERVGSHDTTGSAAAMSGAIAVDGDPAVLRGLAGTARGPGFRAHLASLATMPVSPAARPRPDAAGPDVVAVLGSPNDADGALSPTAVDRCVAAVAECRRTGASLVLVGGFGRHFNTTDVPHWKHCENWILRTHRPGPVRIVGCLESRHTYEDVLLLRELVRHLRPRGVTMVTSDHHAQRARFVRDLVLPDATVLTVGHFGIDVAAAREHEERALAHTVAAALVFGADRPPSLTVTREAGRIVLRPKGFVAR